MFDSMYPTKILKIDPDATGTSTEPTRDPSTGFCEQCGWNEVGLLVAKIEAGRKFDGYTDKEATQKKLLRDVFEKGDVYFNTGDAVSGNYSLSFILYVYTHLRIY